MSFQKTISIYLRRARRKVCDAYFAGGKVCDAFTNERTAFAVLFLLCIAMQAFFSYNDRIKTILEDTTMKVSVIQMNMRSLESKANFDRAEALVRRAVGENGPDVVVLPETWNTGFMPAGDLAAAAALASSLLDRPTPAGSVFFGEVALSGAIRPVGRIEPRLREAARLGFTQAFAPAGAPELVDGMRVHGVSRLQDLIEVLQGE